MSTVTLQAIECNACGALSAGQPTANLARQSAERAGWGIDCLPDQRNIDLCPLCMRRWP